MSSVHSKDGTTIGYTSRGRGPGLILIQGALGTAHSYRDLAAALADSFTVHTPDRRGRGMSPLAFSGSHCIERDVEDIAALSDATGASLLFGLSSGAVIALTGALRLPQIQAVAVYEPPFYYEKGIDHALVRRFHGEIDAREWVASMTTAGEIVKLAPLPVRLLPRMVRERLTASLMQRLAGGAGYASPEELLPAMRYDFAVVGEMSQQIERFRSLGRPVLLLGGTRGPSYLKAALGELSRILPRASRTTLSGLDHSGPWNSERGGSPLRVAEAISRFLLQHPHSLVASKGEARSLRDA